VNDNSSDDTNRNGKDSAPQPVAARSLRSLLYRWTGLPVTDQRTAFALAYIFFAAAVIATAVHFRLWSKEWKGWAGFIGSLR
jgi:hypothetical protein